MPLGRRGRGRRRRGGHGGALSRHSGGRHFGRRYSGGGYGFGIPYINPWGYGGAYSTWGDPLMFMESPPYDPTAKKPEEEKKAIKDLKKKLKEKEKELKKKEKEIKKQLRKQISAKDKDLSKKKAVLAVIKNEKAKTQFHLGAIEAAYPETFFEKIVNFFK